MTPASNIETNEMQWVACLNANPVTTAKHRTIIENKGDSYLSICLRMPGNQRHILNQPAFGLIASRVKTNRFVLSKTRFALHNAAGRNGGAR
jgi:hypothetical protein